MKKFTKPIRKIPTLKDSLPINTIPEMIEFTVNHNGQNLAFLTPREGNIYQITYNQVFEQIKKLARHLRELGIEKGDHVAILGENRPEWSISFFAVAWIGAVAIPLDARASLEDQKFILTFSSAKAIILSGSFYSNLSACSNELKDLKHIVLMDKIDDISKKYSGGIEREDIAPDDLLEILFTSGTTGDPKGVMLSHGNIMSNVSDIYRIIEYGPSDRAFSILPIHHSYECTGGLISTFCSGMSVFYARGLKPRELLEDLKSAKPTIWLNTPLLLEKLYLRIEKELSSQKGLKGLLTKTLPKSILGKKIRQNLGLDRSRLIVSAGAALPAWVSTGFNEYGIEVIQGYGLSEASPLISVNPPKNPKAESVGMIIPSDEVEIRGTDSEGNGEIVARGPNIMKGYYNNREATNETLTADGWLLTGDIGYFDDEGYLYITGRKKFVIVTRGGKNVFPEEIEEKLTKSIYIEEALVFSPNDIDIQAVIYPNMNEVNEKFESIGEQITPDKIWEFIKLEVRKTNSDLQSYKKVRQFAIRVEEFPKTTTRKIKRHLFKELELKHEAKFI
ncbi:MAG: AMP-binding protein [Deltaproteobacteria bacterium]|nr:AMP-binding protein [Deltaproteobacteria bacterium]